MLSAQSDASNLTAGITNSERKLRTIAPGGFCSNIDRKLSPACEPRFLTQDYRKEAYDD